MTWGLVGAVVGVVVAAALFGPAVVGGPSADGAVQSIPAPRAAAAAQPEDIALTPTVAVRGDVAERDTTETRSGTGAPVTSFATGTDSAATGGATTSTGTPPTSDPSNGVAETWAVVVGADRYHGVDIDLYAAETDAAAAVRAYARLGVDEAHRTVLLGDAATADGVRRAIADVVARAGREDRVVFFYAGHAEHTRDASHALLLPDGNRITDVELAAHFADLRAGQAWFTIAACFSAGFDELTGPGRILTAASAADDLAYENLDLGHSYLVEYLFNRALPEAPSLEAAFAAADADLQADFPDRRGVLLDTDPALFLLD